MDMTFKKMEMTEVVSLILRLNYLLVIMPVNIDSTAISSATIDGQEVQEITIDGNVVYVNAIARETFEGGNFGSMWTLDSDNDGDYSVDNGDSVEGNYSMLIDGADLKEAEWEFGSQPNAEKISMYIKINDGEDPRIRIYSSDNTTACLLRINSGNVIAEGEYSENTIDSPTLGKWYKLVWTLNFVNEKYNFYLYDLTDNLLGSKEDINYYDEQSVDDVNLIEFWSNSGNSNAARIDNIKVE